MRRNQPDEVAIIAKLPRHAYFHVSFIHSQLGLTYRSWWMQRPWTALTTSRCHALPSVAGLCLTSAGWLTAVLLQITLLLWTWGQPITQTAPSPWAASSASPHTCRTRTALPVWSNTRPSQAPNSPQSGWRPTVSPHSQLSGSVVVVFVHLCCQPGAGSILCCITSQSLVIVHHDSASHNTITFSCWFFTLAVPSHSAPHTQWQTINHIAQCNALMWECTLFTGVEYMEHHNAATTQ